MSDPLTQARDRIAELCGYVCKFDERRYDETWCDGDVLLDAHPIPACLNFVSKVWPDGWTMIVHRSYCGITTAAAYDDKNVHYSNRLVVEHTDQITAEMILLVKVLDHLQSNDPPAFAAAVEKIRKEIA